MKDFASKYRYQLILVLVSFLLYGNTLKNDYSLDDEFVTGAGNITAKGIRAIPKIFRSFHVQDESKNTYEYRPIVKVAYAIEHQLFGVNPHISHLFNILLYALSLVLLFKLLKLLFNDLSPFTLFLVTLVYACLPIHSEVVVSLKNRDVILSFIFTMIAFIHVLKYTETKKWYHFVILFVCVALALLSKYDILPFLMIGPLCLYQRDKLNLKFIFLVAFISFIAFASTKILRRNLLNREDAARVFLYFESPLYFDHSFMLKISAALNSLGFYAKMLLWPTHMACYYGFNVIPVYSFTSVYAILGILSLGGLAYVFFKNFKKPDFLWYGAVFFGASISMYLNFIRPAPGIVADRFLFFASIGFALIAVQVLFFDKKMKRYPADYKQLKPFQKGISIVLLICCAFLIIKRNNEWKGKLSIFEADSKNYPESVKLSLLATSQLILEMPRKDGPIKENEKLNKVRSSEKLLINAIKIDSTCTGCYNNLGFLYLSYEQDPASALTYLRLGFKGDTTKKEVACNVGIAFLRLNKIDSAKIFLMKAIKLDKEKKFMVPYEALQALYIQTDPNAGIKFFKEQLEEDPKSEAFNILLGKTYFDIKDTLNSLKYYKKVIEINPNNGTVVDFVNRVEVLMNKKYF